MKKIIYGFLLCSVICLSSCKSEPEVMLDAEYALEHTGEDALSIELSKEKDLEEFEQFFFQNDALETDETEEKYDLESKIIEKATIEFQEGYDKNSKTITCVITAPDVYSYIIDNEEMLLPLETEALYQTILDQFEGDAYAVRTVEVELPVAYQNGTLIVDTDSYEYKDAVSGGMYSALTDVYAKTIEILEEELQ